MAPRTGPDELLDATSACVARVGVAKTTLDDVAREAGCARATVYRSFPGKQQLLAALVGRDTDALVARLVALGRSAGSLGDAVVAVMTAGARAVQEHPALAFVAAHEHDVLLPYLAFERESELLRTVATLVGPAFATFVSDARATRLAEWVTRITLSYLFCPSEHFDVTDAAQARTLVDDFVLPGFVEPAGVLGGTQR